MNSTNVPDWYACECCGAHGVQLFRDYGYAMVELLCAPCAEWALSKPATPVPAIPVSLSGRGAWISAGGDAGAMGAWWGALPSVAERRRLFEIQPVAECVAVLEEHECVSVTAIDAVNERDRVDEALAAMVARGLAPDDWPARVDVWDQESDDRLRSEEPFVRCGGIDRFALPAIMRNPIATTTAEQLLLGHVGMDAYAGVRSWSSIALGSRDSAKRLDTLPVAGIGESAVVERAKLSMLWKSAASLR